MVAKGLTPGTISNNISHLRTFYRMAELPDRHLHHFRVHLALRAVALTVRHRPDSKDGVPPSVVDKALQANRGLENAESIHMAILLMYVGFLRQSSVAPPNIKQFDPTRHPLLGDVVNTGEALRLSVKWTKTIQRAADAKVIILPATTTPILCPVKAFARLQTVKGPRPPGTPLLTFGDKNPLTVRYISKRWAYLLARTGQSSSKYTLHSLRRGGASFAYNQPGVKLNDVMTQGTWASMAVRDYIRPMGGRPTTVHTALAAL